MLALAGSVQGQAERFGQVLDAVTCEADSAQRYALYVPSNYTNQKKWPVIFCFDASARGRMPVERLQAAAEKYGYIVAGSLNSRNGPYAANVAAIQAMAKDVSVHFSIDSQRVYTAGVSGGARVAVSVALSGLAKGVIACAAGFPVLPDGIPSKVSFVLFGTTGTEDFNYPEMMRLDGELEERKATHRIVVFEGGHQWASAELLTQAVEWLELQAMRAGTRTKDDALVQALLRDRLAAVSAAPGLERWKAMKSVAADFNGLADTTEFERTAKELGNTREVKEAVKTERTLAVREENLLQELGDASAASASRRKNLGEELRRKADAPTDTAERRMIRRVIASYGSMMRETLRGLFEAEDYDRAAGLLEMAAALQPDQARTWFDLARARALNGEKKSALEALERAVALGFHDLDRLGNEPAFAKLRTDPKFLAALAKLRPTSGDGSEPLQMPAMKISAALANVELRSFYFSNAGGEPAVISFLRVETVLPNSAAARAGIEQGMEITAIAGVRVRGLTEEEFHAAMERPVKNEIVIATRLPAQIKEREIKIPLSKPEALNPARVEHR